MAFHDDVAAVLSMQDDVITRAQVLAAGGTDDWIEAQLAARRWTRMHRKVFRASTGVPTGRQRERAALLSAGTPAALSHDTAARRWGMRDRHDESGPVHLVVPYGHSADPRDGVVLHRSRAFAFIVVDHSDLPTVSPADTCVDLAVARPSARDAMRTLLDVALSTGVSAVALLTTMEKRRPPRYRRALHDAARLLTDGVTTVLEARYTIDVEQAHGLPTARRQVPVIVDGGRRYEDCVYDTPAGELIVRLDGRVHGYREVAVVDRKRDNAAELAGRARLTFGWREVVGECCTTAGTVASRLRQMGWAGPDGRSATCACVSGS